MRQRHTKLAIVTIGILLLSPAVAGAYSAAFTAGAGTTYETPNGLAVTVSEDHNLSAANPFPNASAVVLPNATVESSGSGAVTLDSRTGTQAAISAIDVSSTIDVRPSAAPRLTVSGAVDSVSWETPALDGGSYLTIDASGDGTVTIHGLPVGVDYAAVTGSGDVLTTGTTNADGGAAIDTVSGAYDVTLLRPSEPVITDAAPADDTQVNNDSVTLSATVEDADMPDDELTVEFTLDGETVGSETLTANGTASVTADVSGMTGAVDWSATATDSYGLTDTVSRTVNLPATLYLRNESAPGELVTASGDVTVRFIADDQIYERVADNGTVDLTGLPVDQRMVIQPDVAGYQQRQTIIDSIYEQQAAYLLPDSVESVQPRFVVSDATGEFGADSEVFLRLPIELNGTVEYRTVAADRVGSAGYNPPLRAEGRYVIEVRASDGTVRDLGPYEPVAGDRVILEPSGVDYEFGGEEAGYQWAATWNDSVITAAWEPTAGGVVAEELTITIRDTDGSVLHEERYTDVESVRELLAEAPAGGSVEWEATISYAGDTWTASGSQPVGPGQMPVSFGDAPGLAVSVTAMLLVLIVGGLFSAANVGVGAIVTSLTAGALWFVGALPGEVTGGLISLAIFISVLYYVGRNRQDAVPR